tara:strand:- start:2449 stop:3201 length:753 start_codon:yes stop_codon:yes gene_type:complete
MSENELEQIEEIPYFRMMGDSAINVYLGTQISPEINDKVHFLSNLIDEKNWTGVIEVVPSYISITIHYDPFVIDYLSIKGFVENVLDEDNGNTYSAKKIVVIPTFYGNSYGPDIESVSSITGLSLDEIVKTHTGKDYKVYSIGFSPGFPYLGGLDSALHCPRLESPRVTIPTGSVAIAESQTGIYPSDTPGGWRIIGRTPIQLFNFSRSKPALLLPGDLVRFQSLDNESEFELIKESFEKGDYVLEEITL